MRARSAGEFYFLAIIALVVIGPVRPSIAASESGHDQTPVPAAGTKVPPIVGVAIASAIDEKGMLVNPRFTFPPTEAQITAIIYVGKSNGGQLKVTWYKVSEDEDGKPFDEKLFEHQIRVKSYERAFSVAKNPGGTLEIGRYKVVATLEGQTKETKFDISPAKQQNRTSNRTTFSGSLAGTRYDTTALEPQMQKVVLNASSPAADATSSPRAQHVNRPVAGTSGTAPPPASPQFTASDSACTGITLDADARDSHVFWDSSAQCPPGYLVKIYAGVVGHDSPEEVESYDPATRSFPEPGSWHVCDFTDSSGWSSGSDLPGVKFIVEQRIYRVSDNQVVYDHPLFVTSADDTLAPGVSVIDSEPARGSLVKEGDKINLGVHAWEERDVGWQTGVRRIWFDAKPEGLSKPDEWNNPSRLPKPCGQKTWFQDFQATYTVPKNPPPIIEICAQADDYADNEGSNCTHFATGEWRGTLREHVRGNIYNETVTVLFSFNEERDGSIKGAGRAKLESAPQPWLGDCTSTRKLITPEPLLFPISGKRVGDEFHLELPTDYRLRLSVKVDCPPPKSSGTGPATRSLGTSELFYHPKVKAQDGATNSFHTPGAMDVSGSIELHRAKTEVQRW